MEIMRGRRIKRPTRPHSFVGIYSSEGIGFRIDGFDERQIGHQAIQELSPIETKALLGQSFLV